MVADFDFWRGGDVADRDNTDSGASDEDIGAGLFIMPIARSLAGARG